MADLKVTGRMSVKTLIKNFKEAYGGTLRVYNGVKFADPDATLASIRKGDKTGGEFSANGNMHCGKFEKEMMDEFGIKVNVANSSDSDLVPNDTSLSASGRA